MDTQSHTECVLQAPIMCVLTGAPWSWEGSREGWGLWLERAWWAGHRGGKARPSPRLPPWPVCQAAGLVGRVLHSLFPDGHLLLDQVSTQLWKGSGKPEPWLPNRWAGGCQMTAEATPGPTSWALSSLACFQ